MAYNFDRWNTQFAAKVGKLREAAGEGVTLLYDVDVDDEVTQGWFHDGVKPSEAAERYMAGEARPSEYSVTIVAHGRTLSDIDEAIEEARSQIADGFTSGGNRNETGSYSIDVNQIPRHRG